MLKREVFNEHVHRSAVRFHCDNGSSEIYTYGQLWNAAKVVQKVIEKWQEPGVVVGVALKHSPALVGVLCGICLTKSAFCCLKIHKNIEKYQPAHYFAYQHELASLQKNHNFEILEYLYILSERVVLLRIKTETLPPPLKPQDNIAYCVVTSGSTGTPKFVRVPTQCILPNLEELQQIFRLTADDRIYASASPPSFDPFIVDVFLGLRCGACLVLVEETIRLDGDRLLKVLFGEGGITFLQITPSLLRRWSWTSLERIVLGEGSPLRCLVLGGEPFPDGLDKLKKSGLRIFNIYGITEMSCWATIEQVLLGCEGQVALGTPIDGSVELELRDVETAEIVDLNSTECVRGELYLGSRVRKCLVDGEEGMLESEDVLYRRTGDLVELRADGKYYYLGRCDDMVKRFGVRVSLAQIEQVGDRYQELTKSFAVFDETSHKLLLLYTAIDKEFDEQSLRQYLRVNLLESHHPDELLQVQSFPLTAHGKIDRQLLKKRYFDKADVDTSKNLQDFFVEQLLKLLGIQLNFSLKDHATKRAKLDRECSFVDAGGTSMQAVQLVTSVQDQFSVGIPNLIGMLLDKTVSLKEAATYLDDVRCGSDPPPSKSTLRIEVAIEFRFDMGKCIDATPTIFKSVKRNRTIVAVGSHSHRVIVLDLDSDELVSELVLPDRVESSVSFLAETGCGLVGCYDGLLYCFDLWSGAIRWKFDSGGMIKCKALVGDSRIIFGSYAENYNLFALDLGGSLVWKLSIGKKGILSSPISLSNGTAFVATLDGSYCSFATADGTIQWSGKLESPVFATSVFVARSEAILVAEVRGLLHCFSCLDGSQLWQISVNGNIFSTPTVIPQTDHVDIVFGCHDKHLYCYSWKDCASHEPPELRWKLRLQSPVYAGLVITNNVIVACSTSGYINMIFWTNAQLVGMIKLEGEVFSTPVIGSLDVVYVGCRDNYLYKLDISGLSDLEK
ncbi:beta-alanine-activating enzyme [Culex quinquefasciatus]|uniref:beta-alanine-activating enzyme n=1 Tax=Culex quinquefasciatus TaxID=7176 RepID=UPI0018E37372|nr:beta-alanine-activating enzyme [Culex quinquefasciatus]